MATAEEIAAAQAREQQGAAAAAAINQAYLENRLPVLPANAPGGGAQYTPAEIADAQAEAAKHMAAFHPEQYYGVSISSLGNVPLSQIAGRYGTQFADIVQGYYTRNPTPEAQAIKQQYAQKQDIITTGVGSYRSSEFVPTVAAGAGEFTGRAAQYKEQWQPLKGDLYALPETPFISTVPTRVTGSGMVAGMPSTTVMKDVSDIYMAVGGYQQVRVPSAKLAVSYETGEFGVYQQVAPGRSLYNLVGGGGRAAAQSGMFSFNQPMTEKVYEQYQIAGMQPVSKEYAAAHSKLGAEAYGGFVRDLDARVLSEQDAISRYGNVRNLANYVQQIPAGKAEVPGAKIPWEMKATEPATQYMNQYGLTGQTFEVPSAPSSGRLVGSKVIAGAPTITDTGAGPTKEVPLYEQNVAELASKLKAEPGTVIFSGGLLGQLAFGEKAPAVIRGALGSISDEITGLAGWRPFAESMRQTEVGLGTSPEAYAARTSEYTAAKTGYEADVSKYESALAAYNVAGKPAEQYEPLRQTKMSLDERYTALTGMQTSLEKEKQNLAKTTVYEYGEFSRWGAGAGKQVREALGFSTEQLEAYGTQLEQKKGLEYIPEKIVYGTGYTLSTHPEKIISAYGAGAAMVFGGEVLGAGAEATGLATRAGAFALSHPTTAAIGGAALEYGVPAGLLGATYYSASEGLTATPERTTINIGKGVPELTFMLYGGGSAYGALRAADTGMFGYRTQEVNVRPEAITKEGGATFEVRPGKLIAQRGGIEVVPESAAAKMTLVPPERTLYELPSPMTVRPKVSTTPEYVSQPYIPGEIPLPGVRPLLTGEELGSVSQTTRMGLVEPSKTKTTTEFILGGGIEPRLASQPQSVQTAAFRYGRLEDIAAIPKPSVMARDVIAGKQMSWGYGEPLRPLPGEVSISPVGLETRFGGATGISQKAITQYVNPFIQGALKPSAGADIESIIRQTSTYARAKPAVSAAEAQRIVPSVTRIEQPRQQITGFEDILKGVLESEKRPVSAAQPVKRIPAGIQIDYLREAMGRRAPIQFEKPSAEPFRVATKGEIRKQVAPTSGVATEAQIREMIAPTKRAATTEEIQRAIQPRQESRRVAAQIQPVMTRQVPVTKPVQAVVQPQIQIQPITQKAATRQATTTVSIQQPTLTPVQTTAQAQRQFPARAFALATPFAPSVPTVPISPTANPPGGPPTRTEFPTIPVPPPPVTPTPPTPTKTDGPTPPPPPPPPVPIPTGFWLPSGVGGESVGRRKRKAAFMETFNIGLDIGFLGRRMKAAKSFTTPANKKRKPAAAKTKTKRKK